MADLCEECELKYFVSVSFDDIKIRDFLIKHGVINQLTNCPKCNSFVVLPQGSWEFRCRKTVAIQKRKPSKCNWRGSCKAGSFFDKSRLSIETLWKIITHYLFFNPPRQEFLELNLSLSSKTVVDWYSFIREVYINECFVSSVPLGGPGEIVEIDEAKFGKRKYNRGRRIKGNWVLGGIQRGSRDAFLIPVPDRSRKTLIRLIRRWVRPGTTIITDCWKSYQRLSAYNFNHVTVNHSREFVDPETGAHTNHIERQWRDVRDHIPKYGVKTPHFLGYLAEYQFKKKYHTSSRLHHFMLAAARLYRPRY